MKEHGNTCARVALLHGYNRVLLEYLGAETTLCQITQSMLADLAVRLRDRPRRGNRARYGTIGASHFNHHLTHLQTVLLRARDVWELPVRTLRFGTKRGQRGVLRPLPSPPTRILTDDEINRAAAALQPDMRALFEFSHATGMRMMNAAMITWDDCSSGVIQVRLKSRNRDGELSAEKWDQQVDDKVAGILRSVAGQHPKYVFTYVCKRNHTDPETGRRQRKGERYPMLQRYIIAKWDEACKAAGIEGVTWHTIRATFITSLIDEYGSVVLAQKAVGHKNPATTMRYDRRTADDVKRAMNELNKKRDAERRKLLVKSV
jgi:integrase